MSPHAELLSGCADRWFVTELKPLDVKGFQSSIKKPAPWRSLRRWLVADSEESISSNTQNGATVYCAASVSGQSGLILNARMVACRT